MIIANYTTHLYCDCTECMESGRPVFAEYIGQRWSDTAAQAKKDGWKLSRDKTTAIAPPSAHDTNTIKYITEIS